MELGLYECDYNYKSGMCSVTDTDTPENLLRGLLDGGSKMCCMQDDFARTDDATARRTVLIPLHYFLPEKSSFEI
jgi:hypothetical protein